LFQAIAFLTDRPSGVRENKARVGITWSPSLMCRLQASEAGSPLVVVPLGLIARVYTLALVLESCDDALAFRIVGDDREIAARFAMPPGLAPIFDLSGTAPWNDLGRVQESFGATGHAAVAAARTTAALAASFFVCHEIGHWARMDDLVDLGETGAGEVSRLELRRGIELGADVSGAQMLTSFLGRYPESVRDLRSRADRWSAALYALATGFVLFGFDPGDGREPRDGQENGERVYHDPLIRHQLCTDACELTVLRDFPEQAGEWREAESRAWHRYRGRFGALQAAALAGAFGGQGAQAPYDALGRSGEPDRIPVLEAARDLHDRVAAVLPSLRGRRSSAEFDERFDDSALHGDVATAQSTTVGAALLRRWQEGAHGKHLLGGVLISAVIDLRVFGYGGPIGHDDLRDLSRHYLPPSAARASEDEYGAEVAWACGRLGGAAGCISWVNFSSFAPDPALLAAAQDLRQARQAPGPVLRWAIARMDAPDDILFLAARAIWERDFDIADEALEKAGEHQPETAAARRAEMAELRDSTAEALARREESTWPDDAAGLNHLGLLYLRAGDLEKAEAILRPLAAAGDPAGLCNLGLLEDRRGRTESARRLWEQAAAAGNTRAMSNLGKAAYMADDQAAAQRWFGLAANAGDLLALFNLGVVADDQGNPADAEAWWRVAADSGSTDAMVELGRLLTAQGRAEEASAWWRSSADIAGRQLAADSRLRSERLSLGETLKQWDARVADAHEPVSHRNYGILLAMSGDIQPALRYLAHAADAGDAEAADLYQQIGSALPRPKSRRFFTRRR
jgi:TPR repeat protein